MQQAASPAGGGDNPAIASYRFRSLKVPPEAPRMSLARRRGSPIKIEIKVN
jgi:hypothetical protein